jgi:hypothetical protein
MVHAAKVGRWSLAALALATTACANAFGIDDPTLDRCAHDACASIEEGGAADDATLPDAAEGEDATTEAAPTESDAGPDAGEAEAATDALLEAEPPGVRCGAGGLRCLSTTPYCCETFQDGGSNSFGCVSGVPACSGYSIQCATGSDCPQTDGCCHYGSSTKCVPLSTTNCPGWVCDPDLAGSCPPGKTCSVPLETGNESSPYLACTP